MPKCVRPLTAWQTDDGLIVFAERGRIKRELSLPCGRCVGCRLERARQWSVRCMHESQMHDVSTFVTLTYSPENCPTGLVYRDFQLFMKKLRKRFGPVRFFMCGEYGPENWRPHYHAVLFGVFFDDRELFSTAGQLPVYTSKTLEKIWGLGFVTCGDVTLESAQYCARYVLKKVTGPDADAHYERVSLSTGEIVRVPSEFCRMSLKPGIGATWLEKFHADVYGWEHDEVRVFDRSGKPPRYYDKKYAALVPEKHEHLELLRYRKGTLCAGENEPDRLAVQEQVMLAKIKHLERESL